MSLRDERGLSALEMILTVALLSLVVTVIYSLIHAGEVLGRKGQDQIDQQQNIRIAAAQISAEVRQARRLVTRDVQLVTFQTQSGSEVTFAYDPIAGQIERREGAQTSVVAQGITDFSLTYSSGNRLITMRIRGGEEVGRLNYLETKIYLRNPGSGGA